MHHRAGAARYGPPEANGVLEAGKHPYHLANGSDAALPPARGRALDILRGNSREKPATDARAPMPDSLEQLLAGRRISGAGAGAGSALADPLRLNGRKGIRANAANGRTDWASKYGH
jgi:hypothetical protein